MIKRRLIKLDTRSPDYLDTVNFIPIDGKTVIEEDILNACNTVPMVTAKKW